MNLLNTIAVQTLLSQKMNKKSKVSVDRYDGMLQEHCNVPHNGLGTFSLHNGMCIVTTALRLFFTTDMQTDASKRSYC